MWETWRIVCLNVDQIEFGVRPTYSQDVQTVQFGWLPELQRPRRNLGKRCCNKRRSPDAKNLVIMHNLDLINQARARRSSTTESTFHRFQFRGGAIVNGIWNIVQDRSLTIVLSLHVQFVSSQYHTFYLGSFVWLWPAQCEAERKWVWCNTIHHDTFFHVLSCFFCKYGLATSSHEPWVSFPEHFLIFFVPDVKIGLKMFHDIHVRIVGIAQEDAADVEKLLSCKWCGDFLEHGHSARYHELSW